MVLLLEVLYHLLIVIVDLVDYIFANVAILHFVKDIDQIEVGRLVHRLDDGRRRTSRHLAF